MFRLSSLFCLSSLGVIGGSVLLLYGQAVNSSVGGVVTDRSGAVLPGAEVTLTNLNTGERRATLTTDTGRYVFPAVPVGRYSLRVTLPGFKSFEQSNFEVVGSRRVTIDVLLEVGEITESVTVEAGGLTQGPGAALEREEFPAAKPSIRSDPGYPWD